MRSDSSRWTEISQTQFPWERDALDYVREKLPDHDPYRATRRVSERRLTTSKQ